MTHEHAEPFRTCLRNRSARPRNGKGRGRERKGRGMESRSCFLPIPIRKYTRERDGNGLMNKQEATRIAGAVNALRPDWGRSGLISILADERLRHRAYEDATRAFVALALDPASEKPTRIYEEGPWWHATYSRREHNSSARIPHASSDDCDVCGYPVGRHTFAHLRDHEYRPRNASGPGIHAPSGLTRTTTQEEHR